MATLTNANVGSGAGPRRDAPSRRSGGGSTQPGASAQASALSGEMDDLAAQFNQRRYRPLGISDLFDESFDLYRNNFVLFLGAAALILVPLSIVIYEFVTPSLNAASHRLARSQFDPTQVFDYLGQAAATTIALLIVYGLFFVVLSGASIAIASNRYLGRPAHLGPAYLSGLRRTFPLLLCVVIAFLASAAATVLCVLPGIYVACRFALLPQVVILEPTLNPFAALRRAWRLSSGHFWRISGVLTLLSVVSNVILLSLQGPIQLALSVLPLDSLPFLRDIAHHQDISLEVADVISNLLTTPFTFVTLTALYYDLRIRDEGYDMAILATQLGFGDMRQWTASALPPAAAPTRPAMRPGQAGAVIAQPRRKFWQRNPRAGGGK